MFISKKSLSSPAGGANTRPRALMALTVVAGFVGVAALAPLTMAPAEAEEYAPLARGSVMNQQLMAAATEAAGYTAERFETEPLPEPKPSPTPTSEASPKGDAPAAGAPAAPTPDPGSAQAIARGYVGSDGEFSCLVALWEKESNWNVGAMNSSSGAYGIPQSLPGSKMASAGADWQTNPDTQIRWGLGYIQGRYGSPCGAWSHSQANGWY